MHRAECYVEDTLVEVGNKAVPGIIVTCGLCDRMIEIKGMDTPETRSAALILLRKDCASRHLRHVVVSNTDSDE